MNKRLLNIFFSIFMMFAFGLSIYACCEPSSNVVTVGVKDKQDDLAKDIIFSEFLFQNIKEKLSKDGYVCVDFDKNFSNLEKDDIDEKIVREIKKIENSSDNKDGRPRLVKTLKITIKKPFKKGDLDSTEQYRKFNEIKNKVSDSIEETKKNIKDKSFLKKNIESVKTKVFGFLDSLTSKNKNDDIDKIDNIKDKVKNVTENDMKNYNPDIVYKLEPCNPDFVEKKLKS